MLRVSGLLVVLMAALFFASCATDTAVQTTPDYSGEDSYQGLSGGILEDPLQAGSERFADRSTDMQTQITPDRRDGDSYQGPPKEEMKEGEAMWKGRFVLKELVPVVDQDMVRARLVYMCADPRIHQSHMEPSLKGGITKTRIAVRSEEESSPWLILIDQEASYRMYQVIRWDKIVRALSWAGAEHILLGTVSFGGFTFDSDPAFPLHFKLVQDVGYVYLCGRGTVTTPLGKKHSLGYDHNIDDAIRSLAAEGQLAREAASETLGWLADTKSEIDRAVPALISALKDEAMEVRRNAAAGLGRIGDSRASQALKAALQDEDEWVREVAADALKKLEAPRGFSATGRGGP